MALVLQYEERRDIQRNEISSFTVVPTAAGRWHIKTRILAHINGKEGKGNTASSVWNKKPQSTSR
jgi:hypothetical protein